MEKTGLWHDVEVRSGPDYLPAPQLRRRLELLSLWFPFDRGYRLFAACYLGPRSYRKTSCVPPRKVV
jgi:hypothetical protein